MMQVNKQELDQYVERGLLRRQKHPQHDLYLYKYTEHCAFEKKWDNVTRMCRGLVVDGQGKVVINCMPKFFNYGEMPETKNLPDLPYAVYEKLDGSLIQVAWLENVGMYPEGYDHEGTFAELIVTSSGSFASEHAQKAENLLQTKYWKSIPEIEKGKTYIFEYTGPSNRIVVSYDEERLTLLAVRETATGKDLPLTDYMQHFNIAKEYVNVDVSELGNIIKSSKYTNEEGFIVRFDNGFRVKFKYDEYCRLHKFISGVNEKWIWKTLRAGKELTLDNVPDEIFEWVKRVQNELKEQFILIVDNAQKQTLNVFKRTKEISGQKEKRKAQAKIIMSEYKELSGLIFALIDNKPIDDMVWKMIEPENGSFMGNKFIKE